MPKKKNDASAPAEQITDAVTGTTRKAQLPPLSSIPIPVKKGVEFLQASAGLKNVGEAVAVLVAALIGETIKADDRDESEEAGDAIGKKLAESPAVKTALALYESEREARKEAAAKAAALEKVRGMGFTVEEITAMLSK